MRAACLLAVLVFAKLIVLARLDVRLSGWAPVAYLWQDALVAVVAAAADVAFGRPRAGWVVYGLVVAYVAVSLPVMLALASPLTWPMIHGARGPLVDSMWPYVTGLNVALVALVAGAGATLPLAVRRVRPRAFRVAMLTAAAWAAGGPWAASRTDTVGLDRNALTALWSRGLPAVAASTDTDWRVSPFATESPDDLTRFEGAARGFNVLLVILESTAARYLRPYGAAADPMPVLSAMSEHALRADSAYAMYRKASRGCSRRSARAIRPLAFRRRHSPTCPATPSQTGSATPVIARVSFIRDDSATWAWTR